MLEDLLRMLEDIAIGPQKEQLKESMIEGMDLSVPTRRETQYF